MDVLCLALPFLFLASNPISSLPAAIQADADSLVTAWIDEGKGIDETLSDYYGATALMLAAERNDVDLATRLIAAGADPNARDTQGDTALNWAVYYGYQDVCDALLEGGADARIRGHGNALEIAMRRGFEDLSVHLAERMGEIRALTTIESALVEAIRRDETPTVEKLLVKGADPATRDALGRPALHVAARTAGVETIRALLDAGAKVDVQDPIGFTAVMVAAREARGPVVEALLRAGAAVDHRATKHAVGLTPIHLAAIGGDGSIVRTLAAAGANVDEPDEDGTVPMMWALAEGQMECVITLIDLGADPTRENAQGDSVAAIARRYGIQSIVEHLDD